MRKMHPIWHMYIRSSQARQDSTETTEIMGSTTKQLCVTFAEMDSDLYCHLGMGNSTLVEQVNLLQARVPSEWWYWTLLQ